MKPLFEIEIAIAIGIVFFSAHLSRKLKYKYIKDVRKDVPKAPPKSLNP
jgi:hypothetical protein